MMKKWIKRLIVPAVLVLAAAVFVLAVAFDFERSVRFDDIPPQALDNITVTVKPYYGNVETIELDAEQKFRLFEALDELETRGLSLKDKAITPEDKGYSIVIDGLEGGVVINAAPGVQRFYTLEGRWFKHNLGDTEEMNYFIYRLVEEANN
ncbi:MAG: hypothetical protein IIY11_02400 [Clostridia bacterium]|nr:hypothetical protein [Clostridia bacterium]MBQ2326362.1 hypothetical protein [Clostridia bacterium]